MPALILQVDELDRLDSYDPASGTYLDPDAPVVICDRHAPRDVDPVSGRCWECGQLVARVRVTASVP